MPQRSIYEEPLVILINRGVEDRHRRIAERLEARKREANKNQK